MGFEIQYRFQQLSIEGEGNPVRKLCKVVEWAMHGIIDSNMDAGRLGRKKQVKLVKLVLPDGQVTPTQCYPLLCFNLTPNTSYW